MFERGGFSFVALLVINPIVILLFQNCALIPETQSEAVAKSMILQKRSISSAEKAQVIDLIPTSKQAKSGLQDCLRNRQNCPVSSVE